VRRSTQPAPLSGGPSLAGTRLDTTVRPSFIQNRSGLPPGPSPRTCSSCSSTRGTAARRANERFIQAIVPTPGAIVAALGSGLPNGVV
jgi:hypothetical protein